MEQQLHFHQSTTMNAALQNTLRFLQWSNQELSAFIVQQIDQNPLLNADDRGTEALIQDYQSDIPFNSADCYENMWGGSGYIQEFAPNIPKADTRETLELFLIKQIKMYFPEIQDQAIAMVHYIDDTGYCRYTAHNIAKELNLPLIQVEFLIKTLQQLEPAGVFARSLKECLTLQLVDQCVYNKDWEVLLNHLDLVANPYKILYKKMKKQGIDEHTTHHMVQHLKTLNPKPGLSFTKDSSVSIVPDFLVINTLGKWTVKLNRKNLLQTSINLEYYENLKQCAKGYSALSYIKRCFNEARALVSAIDQRKNLLQKIVTEIITQQQDFLRYGVEYLKKLTLKDVSRVLGVHESTISRAVHHKYITTPQGTYALKYFFSSKIQGTLSPESIKFALRQYITQEQEIQSDQQLVNLLKQHKGITISRRTVAKYRKALNLPTSFQRKKIKNLKSE